MTRSISITDTCPTQFAPPLAGQLAEVMAQQLRYIDDPAFHTPLSRRRMLQALTGLPQPRDIRYDNLPAVWRAKALPKASTNKVALSAEQEREVFQRLHYARYRATRAKGLIERLGPTRRLAWELLRWHRLSLRWRNLIIRYNLPLVVSIASKARGMNAETTDLISEGNVALIRAVEAFDPKRGLKFSTYAWTTVLNALYKLQSTDYRHSRRFSSALDPAMEPADRENRYDNHEQACVSEVGRIVSENRAGLSSLEAAVIRHRFGLDGKASMTFDEVGKAVGRSCERVRQIQNEALGKIRRRLTTTYLDRPQAA